MLAAVLNGEGMLTVEDLPRPDPDAGEILLRVRDCGICGSDLHAAKHPVARLPAGTVMGHEFSGEIAALGRDVRGWHEGDRVVALPFMACGRCSACASDDTIHCLELRGLGLGQLPGAYAEYVRVQPASLLAIPRGVDYRRAALTEPLAVALHGVRMAPVKQGTTCLVMGAGPIGLTTLLWCRDAGATVVVSEIAAGRGALAARLGAAAVVDPRQDQPVGKIFALTGRGAEVVFECIGVRGTLNEALNYGSVHSSVVVLGVCMEPDEIFPMPAVLK